MLSGRYGPYVNAGKVNANVPKGADPAALTMEEAVKLLDDRAAAGGGKVKGRATKPAAKPKAAPARAKPKTAAKPATARKKAAGQPS